VNRNEGIASESQKENVEEVEMHASCHQSKRKINKKS
jgi:hypothetical protein